MQPDAGPSDRRHAGLDAVAELFARLPDRVAAARGAFAVVRPRDRRAPERHNRVADELVDHPAVVEHDLAQHVEVSVEQPRDRFRRDRVAHLGEALEVAEQDEDLLRLAVQREPLGVLDDFLGHLTRQVLAERALREPPLHRGRGARGRGDRGQRHDPAERRPDRGVEISVEPLRLQQERQAEDRAELQRHQQRDLPCAQLEHPGDRRREHDEQRLQPVDRRPRPRRRRAVEHLRDHRRVDLDSGRLDIVAVDLRAAAEPARERRHHPVVADDVAADHHVAPGDLRRDDRRERGIGEQLDRQLGEHRLVVEQRVPIADRALVAGQRLRLLAGRSQHRPSERGRQVRGGPRPQPGDAERVVERDARRLRPASLEPGEERFEILLLLVDDVVGGNLGIGVAHGHGRLHAAQRLDQFVVLVLRLVEQDVDADRLRTHRVEVAQGAGQQAAVERGALARIDQRAVVIDHQQHARVLLDRG